ncbi:hypothetical protein ZIOFF_062145 [Zingiber officinale]|uniref:Uncharacterized protein n=1 Tax=Zingiber officinale TaxID=94328 RepID=A0A8J5F0N1_ZINOF|nr:hypothetical protein ZIOFF_062145 [Zingiber officinale]
MDGRFIGTFIPGDDNGDVVNKYLNLPDSDWCSLPPPPPQVAPLTPLPPSPVDDFDMAILDSIDTNLFWEIDAGATLTLPAPPQAEERGKAEQMALAPFWIPVKDLDCSGCLVMRELIHSDGGKTTKLSLHGGLGFFYHAVLHVYHDDGDGYSLLMEPSSYLDLSTQSLEWVKQFLVNYDIERLRESCVMLQDSLSEFCDALCVRLSDARSAGGMSRPPCTADVQREGCAENVAARHRQLRHEKARPGHRHAEGEDEEAGFEGGGQLRPPSDNRGGQGASDLPYGPQESLPAARLSLIEEEDQYDQFDGDGVQVRSLEREILNLQKELRPGTAAEAENIQAKIDRLEDEKARICGG